MFGAILFRLKLVSVGFRIFLVELSQVSDCERAPKIETKPFLFQSLSVN